MNLKKLLLFMLIGIVCSVSVVSAADINNTAVEIQSNDTTISVDELQNDITIQKFEDNTTDEAKNQVQSDNSNTTDENTLGHKINDCRNEVCSSALNNGLHFNLNDNTAKDTQKYPDVAVAGIFGTNLSIGQILHTGLKLVRTHIVEKVLPIKKWFDEKCDYFWYIRHLFLGK